MSVKNILGATIKELNLMESDMGLVHSFTVKEENMLEIGDKIKCMEKEFYTTQVKKLLMMANGKMINFLAMEHCTINK